MVLQPDPALPITQGQQKIIVVVVLRAKKLHGLRHQVAVKLELLPSHGKLLRLVGDEIQAHAWGQGFNPDVGPGEDGAVHESVQSGLLEADGRALPRGDLKRRRGFPAVGKFHRGRHHESADIIAGWIKRDGVPFQIEHFRGRDDAALFFIRRRQKLELRLHTGNSLRNVEMECKHIHRIASPRERMPAGVDLQPGKSRDFARVRMGARKPFRVEQGERAGRGDGNGLADAENAAGDVGGIH